MTLFLVFGLSFETPVVEMVLVRLGMVTLPKLKAFRSYFIVIAFVIAAIVTPPDVISQFMLAVPMILLYELGIILSKWITPREKLAEAEAEAQAEAAEAAQAARSNKG
jgi:sec-independent protein translocase protein TatC